MTISLLLLGGCAISDQDRRGYVEKLDALLPQPQRPIVVVPGFGQTRLFDPGIGRFVWGTQTSTMVRRFPDDLDLPLVSSRGEHPRDGLEPRGYTQPRGPLDFAWKLAGPLLQGGGYLDGEGSTGIYFFEYDWRLGSDHNARKLHTFLEELRESLGSDQLEIDLIGHSLGALVVTTYLSMGIADLYDSPEEWSRSARAIRKGLGRVVTIANPSHGVPESLRFLADGERFVRREISPSIVATFPIIYELIPERTDLFFDESSGTPIDVVPSDPRFWEILGFRDSTPEELRGRELLLDRAARIRRAHRANSPGDAVTLQLGGDCHPTLSRILVRDSGDLVFSESDLEPSEQRFGTSLFEPGDGSVTRASATRLAAPVALFCDGHHALTSDPQVHRALLRAFLEGPDRSTRLTWEPSVGK